MNSTALLTAGRMGVTLGDCFAYRFKYYNLIDRFERNGLELLRSQALNRLVITVPIGHGKSGYWSQAYPAWILASHPDWRVLLCSSSVELVEEFSATIQRLLRCVAPHVGLEFDPKHTRRDSFRFTGRYRGGLDTAGVGKAIQGRRYDLIVADDLVGSDEAARSPTQRRTLWKWWTADCVPRLQDTGKVVNVMSRRHMDDVVGRSLALNPQLPNELKWHEIRYKAISDDGKALWPGKWPLEKLLSIKADFEAQQQSYQFSALYQQDPRSDPSACEFPDSYFENIFFTELPPNIVPRVKVVACDPSKGTNSKSGDYSAILTMLLDNSGMLWITDVFMRQLPLTQAIEEFALTVIREKPRACIIETAIGCELAPRYVLEILDRRGCRIPIYPYQSMENKKVRIRSDPGLDRWMREKRFRVIDSPGGRLLVSQLQEFPSAEHDDGPDCANMGVSLMDELLA